MSSCMLDIPLCVNTLTTRPNNSMIMVHLIRSLLNSMIAIEAKYFELCKYTVTYVGLNFLQKSSAVAGGGRNACRSDLCQSWRCVVWWFRCTLLRSYCSNWCVWKWGVAPFAPKFRVERVSPYTYQPFLAWSVSGLRLWAQPLSRQTRPWRDSTIQPYANDVSRFVFRAVSHQWGNILIPMLFRIALNISPTHH